MPASNRPRSLHIAALDPDERPGCIQIYGRRPEAMSEAARMVVDLGASLVDVNMGCPSRKVCAHSGGAALLRDPAQVKRIVAAVRAAVSVPLTVKMRTGWARHDRNHVQVARICEGEGADAVTVHWRTREEAFKGAMDPAPIAEVVQAVGIPVVGNGDVVDLDSARRMLDETGCHALMLGRGAIRNPWLPLQLSVWLAGGDPPRPEATEQRQLVLDYLDLMQQHCWNERGALGRSKRFCGYYSRGLRFGGPLRKAVFHSRSMDEARRHLLTYFERLERFESGDALAFREGPSPDED